MKGLVVTLLVLLSLAAKAQTGHWIFGTPIEITQTGVKKVFHHFESSGRRNIAATDSGVAVVWEDNSDGAPRVYWAMKSLGAKQFSPAVKVSGAGDAYEPTILGFSNGRYAIAWEEAGRVNTRIVSSGRLGPVSKIGEVESGQASMSSDKDKLLLAYSEKSSQHNRVMLARISVASNDALSVTEKCVIDPEPHKDDQFYPVIVGINARVLVAWEDRRPGHTIIMATQSNPAQVCQFEKPVRINESTRGPKPAYGAGHGVSRPALATYGRSGAYAIWADKRDYREGYDIYGADKATKTFFGANVRVQDDFGQISRQWHATLAGHAKGRLVAAWEDEREGNADVMLSWKDSGHWSENIPVPGASGPGEQTHPSIVLDQRGDLHLAWVERDAPGGITRLLYVEGKAAER